MKQRIKSGKCDSIEFLAIGSSLSLHSGFITVFCFTPLYGNSVVLHAIPMHELLSIKSHILHHIYCSTLIRFSSVYEQLLLLLPHDIVAVVGVSFLFFFFKQLTPDVNLIHIAQKWIRQGNQGNWICFVSQTYLGWLMFVAKSNRFILSFYVICRHWSLHFLSFQSKQFTFYNISNVLSNRLMPG